MGLFDSGAKRSVMDIRHWNKLSKLGIPLRESSHLSASLADGRVVEVLGSVLLPVELGGKIRNIEFLVLPALQTGLILGADFGKKMELVADFGNNSWSFSDSSNIEVASLLVSHDNLKEEERKELETLLNEWKQVKPGKLGCTSKVEHVIDTGDSAPIKQRYYPVSPKMQEVLDKELDQMLAEGIVEPSHSPWSSPVILVKKPGGSVRFCVDYRKVNSVTKKDAYPLPYVSSILDRLRDAKYLSSIDIKSAYWQVPVEKKSREKTAFTVPNRGLFQFTRMPFGLHNSPATWQRLIDDVIGADLEPYVFVYLDDIIIVTKDFETHLRVLREVLKRLSKANLTLNWEKSKFCRSELKYLGYVVNEHGLLVDPEKVETILNYPSPKKVRQVRRFIGLASWYRRFVPNFSTLISPLTHLLKKNVQWRWGEEEQKAMDLLKEKLVTAPILTCPDFNKPFFLQTDASSTGLGAILFQKFDEGDKPIAYASRSLTSNELKFSTTEQECLAVLWAVEKFRPYLEGTRFTVITDHQALKWLGNLKEPQGRLARWALKLQQYDYEILHRPGKENAAADALSRIHEEAQECAEVQVQNDKWYDKMLQLVSQKPHEYPRWKVLNNSLYKQIPSKKILGDDCSWKLVIPKNQRKTLLQECHDDATAGHMGIFKTLRRLRDNYYWPGMATDVARYISRCPVCLAHKPLQAAPAGLMGAQRKVVRPWQIVSVDIMGPLPLTASRNRFILSFSDYFSKYCVIVPMRNATAKNMVKILEESVLLKFGVPDIIICDNGSQFKSREMNALAEEYNFKVWYTPYYHPQANPMERGNRVIKTMMASYIRKDHRKWDSNLPKYEFAINTAVHEVTGYTPAYINFGRELRRRGNVHGQMYEEGEVPVASNRKESLINLDDIPALYAEVQDRLTAAYEQSSRRYNLRRRPSEFRVGDIVWRRSHFVSDAGQRFSKKLAPKFVKGIVKERIGSNSYRLEDEQGNDDGVWHVQDLKANP